MKEIREQLIQDLININAVSVNVETPFVWTSGIQAPIYCDNRKTIGHYPVRRNIATGLHTLIKTHYPEVEVIGGTATAGIPHGTSVADMLELPFIYFRSAPKEHGTKSAIEGDFTPGQKVVIVEDLISTGGSVLKACQFAREAGLEVIGVVAIFDYQLIQAQEQFEQQAIDYATIATFDDLLAFKQFDTDTKAKINLWKKDPFDTSVWK